MSEYVVRVNFRAMADAAAALRAKSVLFNEQIDQAHAAAGGLRQTWVASGSQAATTYDEYWTKLKAGAQEVFQDIDRLGRALKAAEELQASNETRFAGQFEK